MSPDAFPLSYIPHQDRSDNSPAGASSMRLGGIHAGVRGAGCSPAPCSVLVLKGSWTMSYRRWHSGRPGGIFGSCPSQGLLRTVSLFCKYKILKIWRQPPQQRVRKLQRRWCELIRADIKLPRLELSPRWIWIRTADKEAALGELAFGAGLD